MSNSAQGNALLTRLASPGFLILAAVLFAGRSSDPSYTTPRPAQAAASDKAPAGGSVEALLTQDPLDVVRAVEAEDRNATPKALLSVVVARTALAGAGGPEESSAAALAKDLAAKQHPKLPVRLVCELLRSGDGVEDRERRVRNRQATLYALMEEGYRPVEHHKLHYFRRDKRVVPFEWFERKPSSAPDRCEYALLIWIDEASDDGQPIQNLREVLASIVQKGVKPLTCVIGPTSSGEMIELLEDETWSKGIDGLDSIQIFSPAATARARFQDQLTTRSNSAGPFSIRWTIGDDRKLAKLLVAELFERIPVLLPRSGEVNAHPWMALTNILPKGFGPRDDVETVRVAVLAEANTDYGDQWSCNLEQAKGELEASEGSKKMLQFEPFPFVSPIDGDLSAAAPGANGTHDPDYPIGAKQIDYLRRLGDQLDSSAEASEAPYDAIGIFATDVYDTLLILQALRPRFPHAFFFTTDLDARFLHVSHLPYTRNLIVASHSGLSVAETPRLAAAHVEFRDTYQTTLFRAVRLALGDTQDGDTQDKDSLESPRLHEVGLTSAVELNTPRLARDADTRDPAPQRSRLVYANNETEKRRLDLVREHLQALRGGAFSPLFDHPLVHSVLCVVTTFVAMENDLVSRLFLWM